MDDSSQQMTLLLEMALVRFETCTHQKSFLMAPRITEEGSVATMLLMQESLDQRLGMESLGIKLCSLFGSALVRVSKFGRLQK